MFILFKEDTDAAGQINEGVGMGRGGGGAGME